MQDYQKRIIEEKNQLDMKLSDLNKFLRSKKFSGLDPEDQFRMIGQSYAMTSYSDFLKDRIVAFED